MTVFFQIALDPTPGPHCHDLLLALIIQYSGREKPTEEARPVGTVPCSIDAVWVADNALSGQGVTPSLRWHERTCKPVCQLPFQVPQSQPWRFLDTNGCTYL